MEQIFDYIKQEKEKYGKEIELEDGWDWNMKEHLRLSYLYKNAQFSEHNEDRKLRPHSNMALSMLNVQYRTEGFDVKDVALFVDDSEKHYQSFLVRKFHDTRWAINNGIDGFIDDIVVSYVDYGGVLVRNRTNGKPEVVSLRSLEFCNQRDILNNPFAIKHCLSFSELRQMKEWGKESNGATTSIEDLIELVKKEDENATELDVFEVHGSLPVEYLNDTERETEISEEDVNQIQIVAYYKKEDGEKEGVILFRKREPNLPFKFLKRDKIEDRALGRGGIEELFENIIWSNWTEQKKMEILESASKTVGITDDPKFAQSHPSGLKDVDNLEVLKISSNSRFEFAKNVPSNLPAFNDELDRLYIKAQITSSATDPLSTQETSSGTPFKLFEAKTQQALGMHEYRQGQISSFVAEIYKDWIIPHIQKEIAKGDEFISELSYDEMQELMDSVINKVVNDKIKKEILGNNVIDPQQIEIIEQREKEKFLKSGNKRFFKLLKNEITKPLSIKINIVNKQKNLAMFTDKLVNLVREFVSNPQLRQDPELNKFLNQILESSGLSPIMYNPSSNENTQQTPQPNPQPNVPQPAIINQ